MALSVQNVDARTTMGLAIDPAIRNIGNTSYAVDAGTLSATSITVHSYMHWSARNLIIARYFN